VKFIAGLILGLILVPFGAYVYFTGGSAPVATTDSDMPFENYFAHKALNARIKKEMPKAVPIQPTDANYLAGADLYKQHCAVCHGLPLVPKTAIATARLRQIAFRNADVANFVAAGQRRQTPGLRKRLVGGPAAFGAASHNRSSGDDASRIPEHGAPSERVIARQGWY